MTLTVNAGTLSPAVLVITTIGFPGVRGQEALRGKDLECGSNVVPYPLPP